ncbi:MAG: ATP-binding protein [Candidatus Rokubacteria bacterium]|nr:ATP-binding protein [Candidatus Rokubacteria bacterium]
MHTASYYPRSFLRLLLAGFSLVALPLVFALITSSVAVDRIASRSQTAVYEAVQATQSSRRLSELLTALERTARQIVILNDRSLLDAYKTLRAQFQQAVAQFADLPFDAGQRADLEAIVKTEQQIFDALTNPAIKPATLQAQVSKYIELSYRAQAITAKSGELIDREVEAMRKAASEAQRIMLWQALALIPVMIFLVIGFTILISRPIRQIDAAIRELGSGKFNSPVVVSGPEDLEYLGERLELMRQQLFDLEQQKNRFLQQISHDLKTPLTALREGTQLLSDDVVGQLTPGQREIVQILRQNSIKLQQKIEDLLNYGSIQFHKLKLDLAPVNPRRLWDLVAHNQKLALQAKNLTVQAQVADVMLNADAEKILVMLDNLLSNAIKFSPAGGTITVNMRSDGGNLAIDVIDEGPGIAADRQRVFEPFYQGRIEGSGPAKGSGLGLSIVKEYAAAHGGSVEVVAEPGARGAHLRVQLPLKQEAS